MAKILLEPFRNVSAAGTAFMETTRVYPNTLEYIAVRLAGTVAPTKAQLTRIQVKLGQSTKPIWDITGAQLNSINLYEGRPNTATVLLLPFANPRARTIEAQMIGALDLGAIGIRQLLVEITIAGGTAPALDAWAEVSPPKLFGPGRAENQLFRAILTTPLSFTGAVNRFPQNIATAAQGGALLRRLHFFAVEVTSYELRRDGIAYHEDVPVAVNNGILDELGHDPQVNIYTFDATEDDNESKALAQVREDAQGFSLIPQQHLVTVSGAITVQTIADVFANVNGL